MDAKELIWASPIPPGLLTGEVVNLLGQLHSDAARAAAADATAVFNEFLDVGEFDGWLQRRGYVAVPEGYRLAAQAFADGERERLGLRLFD